METSEFMTDAQEIEIREAAARQEFAIGELSRLAYNMCCEASQAVDMGHYDLAARDWQLLADLARDAHEQCNRWLNEFQSVRLP